jgi:hypothetical protein
MLIVTHNTRSLSKSIETNPLKLEAGLYQYRHFYLISHINGGYDQNVLVYNTTLKSLCLVTKDNVESWKAEWTKLPDDDEITFTFKGK